MVARLKLPDLTMDKQFYLYESRGYLANANVIASLPANPKSAVVGRIYPFLAHTLGFAIYDDGVQRPAITTAYVDVNRSTPEVNSAQLSSDGNTLYGAAGEGSLFSRWLITPQGFVFDRAGATFDEQLYLQLSCQLSICLTGGGHLADTSSLQLITRIAQYPNDGLPLLDLDNNRMFLLRPTLPDALVESFDATTYQRTGQYFVPGVGYAHTFSKVADNQLAIAGTDELALLPISMLKP
jgi:hypothetical protein